MIDRETYKAAKKAPHLSLFHEDEHGMQFRDTLEGTGVYAKEGDLVYVHYQGTSSKSGRLIENTMQGKIFPQKFTIGTAQRGVIKAIDFGVRGMRKGGRRQLIVPPDLAYPGILEEVTIYEVDLLKVEPQVSESASNSFGSYWNYLKAKFSQ